MRANSYSALCANGAGTCSVGAPVTGIRARALVRTGRGCFSSGACLDSEGAFFGCGRRVGRAGGAALSTAAAAWAFAVVPPASVGRRCLRPPRLPRRRFGLVALSSASAFSGADSARLTSAWGSLSRRRPLALLQRRDSDAPASLLFEGTFDEVPGTGDWLSSESETGERLRNRPRGLFADCVVACAIHYHLTPKAVANAMTIAYNLSTDVESALVSAEG